MNTVEDKLEVSASSASSSAGIGPTLSVAPPSPAQSNTDVSKYAEELIKDPTVLRSATSVSKMFKGGSKNNVTTIFAKNLIESATSDLLIEIESCSSMSSGSCESGMDMMDSVLDITGLIHAEKNRIKGECSREDLGLLSQITKFKPISRETTETHQRESTHELVHRRDSKGATTEHLHKSQSITTMADVRQGKIRTASGKTLRIRCSKTNEILRQKMIYNARQELAPPKKKKFKTIAKAIAWTMRNRLAFMKGDAPKTKEQEEEEKIQKLAKIFTTNVIKGAVKKYELEERQDAIRQERRRRANRRKFTTTANFFGELEDFPDPRPWVKKFDKNHNPNNKALAYWVREIQRQVMVHELGPPPPGLDLSCSNLSLRHSKHSDLKMACHAETEEEPAIFSGRKNSSVYFAGTPPVREEDKLSMAVGGAPEALHFTSQSSAVSQKSTVTKYGKGKKKDTASLETSQAVRKTTLAFTPPPPPPPLPGCLPGGSAPARAAPVVYTTQTAEVGQRATVSSREQDGTEVSTETATMATMMEAQFAAPPAAPPLPPPDYYLLGVDESDDEMPKEQAPPPEAARPYVPPNFLGRFQSQGFRHVEFNPSPRGSVAGSDVGSGSESRDTAHGMMQPRRDSLAFRLQSQSTQLKHSTTVRRKTSTGETEDTAEASRMVATVQADRVPSPPPLPSFGLGLLSAHPMSMSPLSSVTLGQALHDAMGRRDHVMPGHMQSSSPGNDSLSFRLQSQSTKLKHSTTVRRKTSTGETEDTAEASQMVATVQAERIPTPPPLPAFGLGGHGQIAPPATLALPSAAPTMGLLSHSSALPMPQLGGLTSLSGGTAMRHTSASSKVTQKTSVKKGDETVENVAEASQAMATTEVMQIPPPPPLPTSEQLRRPSLPRATPHLLMHGAGFGRVPLPPTLPPMELLMTGISGGFGRVPSPPALPPMELLMAGISGGFGRPQPNMALQMAGPSALSAPQSSLLSQGHGQGGGTFMRSTTASNKMTHKTKVTKGDETVENVAEASETVGTMEVGIIPEPPPLPTREQLRRPSLPGATPHFMMHGAGFRRVPSPPALPPMELLMAGISGGFGRAPSPPALPPMELLMTGISGGFGRVPSPPALPPMELLMAGISGGFGRVPSPPALPPMELLMAGISGGFGRVPSPPALPPMELLMAGISGGFGRVPSPPALPPMELLMAGISGGFGRPQPNMALQMAGPSALSAPQSSLLSQGHGQGGGTFMRSTTASNKMTHKTKVTKGDETVENVAEASETVGTMEVGHIPEPPPLPTREQLRPPIPQATPQLNMALQMAGPSALAASQYPPSLMSPGHGQGGGTFMRSTTASNKMTHKTKVTKGDETVEHVAEAGQTVASMEAGHIPAPPPMPTQEQLRRPSTLPQLPQATPQSNMALMFAGPAGLVIPQPPPLPASLMSSGRGGGTFLRSTTASNKMMHKTKVTKGDETVENVAEASETVGTMEVGIIPEPPPLPTREQLRRPSLPGATPHFMMHGAGFGRVPSPPTLPPMELLMAGISDISGRVPSPPALPPMEFLMSEIRYTTRQVPNPPALPTMEFLMSGISGSPRPLLDLVGSGSMQPVPDPTLQYTVMSMGTVEGGKVVMARKEYSQKVREALLGNDNESGSSKAQDTLSKDAKKSDLASNDVAAKMSGPDGSTKIKGPQEAGDSETKDTPKKTVITYMVVPSKPTASAKVASASSIATSTYTASSKYSPPSEEESAPVSGPSGQTTGSTQDKKEKPILEASQKGANVPKAGPSGVQSAKSAPTKIPQSTKGVDVKGKTPIVGTTALSDRVPGATSASYKPPDIGKEVKYDVDRSPVMLPGHFGASTGVRSRPSMPGTGLVPKKLDMEVFDWSEDSEDELDLDKPISVEDLKDDEYWEALEKKAYAMVKKSMEQLETVEEDFPEDETPVQEASPTTKKPSKFSQMFQSRKEKERKREREARKRAMKEEVSHKSAPSNAKPFYGPPLPPVMQKSTPEKKKRGLTRHWHQEKPTLVASKAEDEEPSASKKSGGRLTPSKLVGKIKDSLTRVKDSIKSRLSGEESDSSFSSDVE
ncbi:uncharacterized protein LOC144864368 isoform X2 [Branchiostoma floridae x Branchiostoma japonicum]